MNVTRDEGGNWIIYVSADEGVRFRGLFAGEAEVCPAGTLDALKAILKDCKLAHEGSYDRAQTIVGIHDKARAILDAARD